MSTTTETTTAETQTISDSIEEKNDPETAAHDDVDESKGISRTRGTAIIVVLTGVSFLNTMGSGLLTTALPRIASDIDLSDELLLWPASVYALAAGCLLVLFGNIADLVGAKKIWLTGSVLYIFFTLGCGLAQTAAQFIALRTCLGAAIAMCLPASFGLVTKSFEPGRWRNVSFACLGMGQPLGYSVGLILGGVFTQTIGWRYGYYISAIINAILSGLALWALPSMPRKRASLLKDIDWIGVFLISASLALMSYFLATVSQTYTNIGRAANIVILVISVLLLPTFVYWMHLREKSGKSAIVPNSLWRNSGFSSICAIVFLTWGVFNAFQYFSSFYFQLVQNQSALQTSIRFLPLVVVGALVNIVTGFFVDKVGVRRLITISAVITTASPLIMAFSRADWIYWLGPFFAMLLSPLHPDVLFTVSSLVISSAYSGKSQSLAGAVFNTVSQFGNSVGLAVCSAIAGSVTAHSEDQSLLEGYHAVFWLMFASMVVVVGLSWFGLRRVDKVGGKET